MQRAGWLLPLLVLPLLITATLLQPLQSTSAAAGTSVSLTTMGTAYTQDFNTLASSGTSSALPTGWGLSESGANANTTYRAGTGTDNTGDTYSFGASGSAERAFGGLQSGSLVPTVGACFTNNTGGTITTLAISYTGEQWRLGATGRADRLDFQLSTDATSLTSGTYVDYDALDFPSLVTTGTVGALNGNATAKRTAINFTITGLNIVNGQMCFIRWLDLNASGADDGLAVDDFSLTPSGNGGGSINPSGNGSANPATINPGDSTLLTVNVFPATNPPSTGIAVKGDLAIIGGSATQIFFDDATHGDATADDNVFSFLALTSSSTTTGTKSLPVTITDAESRSGATSILLTVQAPSSACSRCGVERWSVKTGTDPDAGLIHAANPVPTTLAIMRSWPTQTNIPSNARIQPYETTVWVVEATLTLYKKEDDSDYHLVLQDASGNTIVSEIPCASCVGTSSPFQAAITNARNTFNARLTATTSFQTANIPVRITGIGMFDFPHGQTGAAPNQIELHPIIDIVFNPGCTYGATNAAQFFLTNGGDGSVNVTASGACTWSATSNTSWITLTSSDTGFGNDVVTFQVRENFTRSARQGTLTVAGQTVTVTQDGGLGDDCGYAISPTYQAFSQNGGTGTVSIAAAERCAWQAASSTNWITITSGPNGIGNGAVTYTVAANPGTSGRKGSIIIAGQEFAIKQKGG